MAEMSPGTALRDLQKAQSGMKKVRSLLKQARENPRRSMRSSAQAGKV